MKELLETIVFALVDEKDQVVITEEEDKDGNTVLKISAAPNDVGRIIGKNGNTITAIRKILRAYAVKQRKRVIVDVL
ncbi:MAG TPA: KH domain-containing protein [Clostridia bacterium]|jgi:predicted RNA-binding protein YlqC (UPF0109 family)|nr:KH domain-containing protein [Clostridiaceae bacterium]HOF25894.1 KH domain-containing protein [Clostridia bacterium]HOM33663.1 KH domain-containing protein [Clostridia bacterium]HOR88919.1 KH domain-containing protein [Clostridia bacterium]HOT71341.1 KH domain-containing protein [Clostridia bacterium]